MESCSGVVLVFFCGVRETEARQRTNLAEEVHAVAEHVERPAPVHDLGDFFHKYLLGRLAVVFGDEPPHGRSGLADEGDQDGGGERKIAIGMAAVVGEPVFDGRARSGFRGSRSRKFLRTAHLGGAPVLDAKRNAGILDGSKMFRVPGYQRQVQPDRAAAIRQSGSSIPSLVLAPRL
ncbi:MAG: hypothetical protein JO307_04485 [Bryobacterales bacterium]|nr:hypothetical protein [Bryobacterales bacterium]